MIYKQTRFTIILEKGKISQEKRQLEGHIYQLIFSGDIPTIVAFAATNLSF